MEKVRENVGLSAPMNKVGCPTYLGSEKGYLIVAAADIEGGHSLPLEINSLLDKLQHVIKAVNLQCGDNDILDNFDPQVLPPSLQACQ